MKVVDNCQQCVNLLFCIFCIIVCRFSFASNFIRAFGRLLFKPFRIILQQKIIIDYDFYKKNVFCEKIFIDKKSYLLKTFIYKNIYYDEICEISYMMNDEKMLLIKKKCIYKKCINYKKIIKKNC